MFVYGRYHPIYESLWDDLKFNAMPERFQHRSFFTYLCSHRRTAPAGIYAVTPEVLAAEVEKEHGWVVEALGRLAAAGMVVYRDGVLWVVKYLERQQNKMAPSYKTAVVRKLKEIGLSHHVVQAFLDSYTSLGGVLADPGLRQVAVTKAATRRSGRRQVAATKEPTKGPISGASSSSSSSSSSSAPAQEPEGEKTLSAAADNGFDLLWSLHPGPKGPKGEALQAYSQVKPPPEAVEAMRAQVAHKAECDRRGVFCPQLQHLHRWIKKRRWEDELPLLPKPLSQRLWDEAQEEKARDG